MNRIVVSKSEESTCWLVPESSVCRYVDTAFGSVNRRNKVVSIDELKIPKSTPDCYVGMFRYPKEYKDHCDKTGSVSQCPVMPCYADFVWFDIDNDTDQGQALDDARSLVQRIGGCGEEILGYLSLHYSGSKGFHVGIPSVLFGLEPAIDLPAQIKNIALSMAGDIPIDTSIYERNRLWRVPNTKNSKSGLYKIELTCEQLMTMSIDQIKERAKQPLGSPYVAVPVCGDINPNLDLSRTAESVGIDGTQFPNDGGNRVVKNSSGWISEALNDLGNGNRNNTFAKVAGRLHYDGWPPEGIVALLLPHAERVKFPIQELEAVVSGICHRYPNTTQFPISDLYKEEEFGNREIQTASVVSFADLVNESDEGIDWLVDGIFPSEGVGIIGGAAGIGKSWMLLDLAIACAQGNKWLGEYRTKTGSVLYVDEESSRALLKNRCKILTGSKQPPNNINFLIGEGICLTNPENLYMLQAQIKRTNPGLVILDSLVRLHRSEENSASEMAKVFAVVKELVRRNSCLFVFADHNRKPGEHAGSPQYALRGSSEKVAFVDTLLSVTKKSEILQIEHTKSRFGAPVPKIQFRLDDLINGRLHENGSDMSGQSCIPAGLKKASDLIQERLSNDRTASRPDLVALGAAKGISKKTVDGALRFMTQHCKLSREDRRPPEGRGGHTAHYSLTQPTVTTMGVSK